jgi:hypothetical protein
LWNELRSKKPIFEQNRKTTTPVPRWGFYKDFSLIDVVAGNSVGVLPEHWTTGMLGFPPTEENPHEEEQIYR